MFVKTFEQFINEKANEPAPMSVASAMKKAKIKMNWIDYLRKTNPQKLDDLYDYYLDTLLEMYHNSDMLMEILSYKKSLERE